MEKGDSSLEKCRINKYPRYSLYFLCK